MYLGVDYYPEHWDRDMMDEDLKRMKKMGVNMIRIGEFVWHMMEREEGEYDFSFFDEVILKAKDVVMDHHIRHWEIQQHRCGGTFQICP